MVNDTMPSYITAMDFLLLPNPRLKLDTDLQQYTNYTYFSLPQGYVPKVTKVGPSSLKIYISDGGKYSEPSRIAELRNSVRRGEHRWRRVLRLRGVRLLFQGIESR